MTYFVHSEKDRKEMLKAIGLKSIEELFQAIPEKIRDPRIDLDEPLSERGLKEELTRHRQKKQTAKYLFLFFRGRGL